MGHTARTGSAMASGLALAALCVAGCGSNGHNGHVWQDYRETYDASVTRPGNGGTGPRVRGQWTIVDYDIRIHGTLSLYPPPHTTSNAERAQTIQSQLTTEQRMTVTVRIPDRPGDITSPVQLVEVEVMSQGYAILDGIPTRSQPLTGLNHPAVQASHRGEIWIYPGLASRGGTVERLYLKSEGQGISLAEDAEKDSLLAYDFDGVRSLRQPELGDFAVSADAEN